MKRILVIILLSCSPCYAATQFDFLLSQVRTSAQGALVGGKVYFYTTGGTTTLKTIYVDRNGATPANNPYTLDANATAQLYGTGAYRIVIKDASGVIRYDRDNIVTAGDDGTINAIDCTAGNQTFLLPSGGIALVCKTDATANTVTITPSVGGQTSPWGPLTLQGECIRLGLYGNIWYKE